MVKRAVVLLSGGLDSATVLALARAAGCEAHTLSVDYGQRHRAELVAAERVATALGAASHRVVRLDLASFGGSALTDSALAVPCQRDPQTIASEIPLTYVPARNTVLLAVALAYAETLAARELHIGINAVDYSGYPDCRPEFVIAFEALANLATRAAVQGERMRVIAPLERWSKARIIQHGVALGVDYALTVSCYQADATGAACGACDACYLRRCGFAEAGLADPTRYR
jgi:7-cyano-7-deazaguanine synthase